MSITFETKYLCPTLHRRHAYLRINSYFSVAWLILQQSNHPTPSPSECSMARVKSSDRFQIKALESPRLQSLPHFSRSPTTTKICLKKFQVSLLSTAPLQPLTAHMHPEKPWNRCHIFACTNTTWCSCSGYQLQSAPHLHSNSSHRLMRSCSWYLFYCLTSVQKCISECRREGRPTGDSKPDRQINYHFDI